MNPLCLGEQAVGMMDGHELHTFCSSGDMHERHTSLFPFRQVRLRQQRQRQRDKQHLAFIANDTTSGQAAVEDRESHPRSSPLFRRRPVLFVVSLRPGVARMRGYSLDDNSILCIMNISPPPHFPRLSPPTNQILCQLLELDQDRLNLYAAGSRPPPATGPSPAAAAAAAAAATSTAAMTAAAAAAAAGAAGIVEMGGEVASRRDSGLLYCLVGHMMYSLCLSTCFYFRVFSIWYNSCWYGCSFARILSLGAV